MLREPVLLNPTEAVPSHALLLQRVRTGVAQYLQLASVLRHQIQHGDLKGGQRLPTVVQLAQQYQVARITVRQAYGILSNEGLITSQRGRGSFVEPTPEKLNASLHLAINDPRAQGVRFDILERQHKVPLPDPLARGAPVYPDYAFVRKVHLHDDEPFCLAEIYVASDIQARFPKGSDSRHKIAYLVNEYAPERMHTVQQTMTVIPADLVLSNRLKCSLATPMAHMVRRISDRSGRMALAGLFWYRGDRFIADMEIPYDVWLNYPGVVVPESKAVSPGA